MREVLINFMLFGVIEIFILLMFYKKIGGIKEVKYWHILLLSSLYSIIVIIEIPFAKQIILILFNLLYLYVLTRKDLKGLFKLVIYSFCYVLVIETIYCILIEIIKNVDITKLNSWDKFIYLIPIRILEIGLMMLGGVKKNGTYLVRRS